MVFSRSSVATQIRTPRSNEFGIYEISAITETPDMEGTGRQRFEICHDLRNW